jgi:hypothetical protein
MPTYSKLSYLVAGIHILIPSHWMEEGVAECLFPSTNFHGPQCLLLCVKDLIQHIFARGSALFADGHLTECRGWQVWFCTATTPCDSETEPQIISLTFHSIVLGTGGSTIMMNGVRTVLHPSLVCFDHPNLIRKGNAVFAASYWVALIP